MKNNLLSIIFFFLGLGALAAQRNACPPPHCACEDGLSEMQLYYFGAEGEVVDIEVSTGQSGSTPISALTGVASGDLITISAAGLPNGRFTQNTDFRITNTATGEACSVRIYSRCPSNAMPDGINELQVLGKKFGPLFVAAYTSAGNSQQCDLSDVDQYWRVGGNVNGEEAGILGNLNREALRLFTDNIERGRISPEGNWGIGLTMPEYKLDLGVTGSDLMGNGNGIRVTAETPDGGISLRNTAGNGRDYYIHSTGDGSVNNSGNLAFGQAGQNADMVLTPDGQLAIGSRLSPPNTKLYVVGERVRFNAEDNSQNLEFLTKGLRGVEMRSTSADLIITTGIGHHLSLKPGLGFGNVGVGMNDISPQVKFHVQGDAMRLSPTFAADRFLELRVLANQAMGLQTGDAHLVIRSPEGRNVWINYEESDGKVAIGTLATPNTAGGDDISEYKLYVAGGILTEEVRVRTGWADYVFEEDYRLRTLAEVEKHIEDHGYLPDMPSAAEVESSGLPLGVNAVNQQVKIEEIFLHLIEMNKQIEHLADENAALKMQVEQMEKARE